MQGGSSGCDDAKKGEVGGLLASGLCGMLVHARPDVVVRSLLGALLLSFVAAQVRQSKFSCCDEQDLTMRGVARSNSRKQSW